MTQWRRFAQHLGQIGVASLGEVTTGILDDYANHLLADRSAKRRTVVDHLSRVAEISAFAAWLPPADRMVEPSWVRQPLTHPDRRSTENAREVIHPDTFAPLLWWSQRILDCAPDILDAIRVRRQLTDTVTTSRADYPARMRRVAQIVADWNGVLPTRNHTTGYGYEQIINRRDVAGRPAAAGTYLSAMGGGAVHPKDFGSWARMYGGTFELDEQLPAPLPMQVMGRIEDKSWLGHIDFRDVHDLQRILMAAAAVVICTCSGMRGQELLSLEPGCLRAIDRPDGLTSFRIAGRVRKSERDNDGQHALVGRPWQWATITPGAHAIQVLEALAELRGNQTLLATIPRSDSQAGAAMTGDGAALAITQLIAFANDRAQTLGIAHPIPVDPAGRTSLDRFRRTVAWHIVTQPDGLIAAGVQFGHCHLGTTDAYAGIKRSGIKATMDTARTEALYSVLQSHYESAIAGGRVSGPSAGRLTAKVLRYAQRFPDAVFAGTWSRMSPRDQNDMLKDPDLQVYDNPGKSSLCVYDPRTAGCRPKDDQPDRGDCRDDCVNHARTDLTIQRERQAIATLQAQFKDSSPLMVERFRRNLARRHQITQDHETLATPMLAGSQTPETRG